MTLEQRLAVQSATAFKRADEAAKAGDNVVAALELIEGLKSAEESALAGAYRYLQVAVGVLAVSLVPVLLIGHWATHGHGVKNSISAYYYSHVGTVFVGVLWALGVFFLSYHVKPVRDFKVDHRLAQLASVAAVAVAVFPTANQELGRETAESFASTTHGVAAGLLFVLLGIFAMFRFTKNTGTMTPKKRQRNTVFRVCGSVIFGAIGVCVISMVTHWPILVPETLCVEAFGISWLVKAGFLGFLADPKPPDAVR